MRHALSTTVAASVDWGKPIPAAPSSRPVQHRRLRSATVTAAFVAADLGVAAASLAAVRWIFPGFSWSWTQATLATLCLLVPLHAFAGLYATSGLCPIERLRRRVLTALGLGAAAIVTIPAWHTPADIAAIGLAAALLSILGHYAESATRALLTRAGFWGVPTLLLGSPQHCLQMARTLARHPEYGLRAIGVAADLGDPQSWPEGAPPVLCSMADAHQLAGIAEVAIIAAPDWEKERDATGSDGMGEVRLSRLRFAHMIVAEVSGGLPNVSPRTRNLGNAVGLEVNLELLRFRNLAMKRLVDLAGALPALLFAAPVIAVCAIAVKLADRGPAFYCQRRVGRDGRELKVWKLRTMYGDAEARLRAHLEADPDAREEWSRFFKLADDPRILPGIGHFLRRSSLDELPQIWNIVRGDMSLVGPRPFPEYHMQGFDPAFQAIRVSVPPGLTGLWQVSARSDGDLAVQKEQDLFYIRNWSIWLDLFILVETLPAVFLARGAK